MTMDPFVKCVYPSIVIVVLLGCFGSVSAQQTLTPEQQRDITALSAVIQPDVEIQSRIRELLATGPPENALREQEFRNRIRELRKLGGEAYSRLVPQLIHFTIYTRIMGQRDDFETWLPGMIIDELEIGQANIAAALVPYIDTGNEHVDREVRGHIGDVDNFRIVLSTKMHDGEELPRALIQHLYKRDAGRTLLMIQEALGRKDPKQWRPVLWAEHQVADVLWKWGYGFLERDKVEPVAADALLELATHKDWWARLYVAHVLQQYKPFRSPALMAILRDDADESVRAVMQEIPPSDAQKAMPR